MECKWSTRQIHLRGKTLENLFEFISQTVRDYRTNFYSAKCAIWSIGMRNKSFEQENHAIVMCGVDQIQDLRRKKIMSAFDKSMKCSFEHARACVCFQARRRHFNVDKWAYTWTTFLSVRHKTRHEFSRPLSHKDFVCVTDG